MNILGINCYHADSSASIFVNNKLEFAIEEERLNRIKNWSGFPALSIAECLKFCDLKISDINLVVINQDYKKNLKEKLLFFLKNPSFGQIIKSIALKKKKFNLRKDFKFYFPQTNKSLKIYQCEHHISHVYSSFVPSQFKDSCFLTIDGFGDFVSTMSGFLDSSKIDINEKIFFPHSLGILYQAMTQFLGFNSYGDEYKVMGLSSYGEATECDKIKKIINYDLMGNFNLNLEYFNHHNKVFSYSLDNCRPVFSKIFSNNVINILGTGRIYEKEITKYHMNLAASLQKVYEDIFFLKINKIYEKYQNINLCIAGGCAHNSVANGKIKKRTKFKNIYIPSAPGDAGGAIGSVFYFLNKNKIYHHSTNPYLGNDFSHEKIKEYIIKNEIFLKNNNCNIEFLNDFENTAKETSLLLSQKKIIGWFQGRSEWGPRALGNRSILGDPRDANFKDLINRKIKKREDFRPFAPSIMEDQVNNWFVEQNICDNFMSGVYVLKNNKKNLVPAITHFDGTARVQTVNKNLNYKFYQLINYFFILTNIPMLLNTSFNENEPIVNNPQEAIDCFLRTKMDVLVIENCIIKRKNNEKF